MDANTILNGKFTFKKLPNGSIKQYLEHYKAEPLTSMDDCPKEWWSTHERSHSEMARFAPKYLLQGCFHCLGMLYKRSELPCCLKMSTGLSV